jgi:hypothetical protein
LINHEQVRRAHESDCGKKLMQRPRTVPLSVKMQSLFESAPDDDMDPPSATNPPTDAGNDG